jgi:hypothetical protein
MTIFSVSVGSGSPSTNRVPVSPGSENAAGVRPGPIPVRKRDVRGARPIGIAEKLLEVVEVSAMPGQEEVVPVLARTDLHVVVQPGLKVVPGGIVRIGLGASPQDLQRVDVGIELVRGEGIDVFPADHCTSLALKVEIRVRACCTATDARRKRCCWR